MSTLDLIGRVTARRLRDVREAAKSRAFYCLVGLDPAVTSAIARHVATDGLASGMVEVLVHPRLNDGSIAPAVESDLAAPWIRNHPTSGKLLTLCTVPADKVKETIPTLEHSAKIDDAWLLQDPAIWAEEGLNHSSTELRASFAETLRGVLASGVAHDAVTVASFVSRVHRHMDKAEGLTLEKAVRAALPELRLPRNAGDPRLKVGESSATAERFFRKTVDEAQPALTLKTKEGDPLNKGQLRERLQKLRSEGVLDVGVADALTDLLDDRSVRDGSWTDTQRTVAELGWEAVEPFFADLRTKVKQTFGAETKEFFDQRYPGILKKSEEDLLVDLPRDSMKPSERIDAFFAEHKVRLQSNAKLYKRWEKLVFRAAIETSDLAEGLLRLAHLASPEGGAEDDDIERVLVVKLRHARRLDFWTTDKNTRVLRYLRDRYRGLADLLAPHVVLDFGRCWSEDWETQIPDAEDVDSRARTAVDLEFEASLVPPDQVQSILDESVTKPHANRAQMLWRPSAEALGLSLPLDLRLIRPKDEAESTRLMTGAVQQNRSARGPLAATVDLAERTTVVDSFGQSDGLLANVNRTDHRIDLTWPSSLEGIVAQGVLTAQRGAELKAAFDSFVDLYGSAIRDLLHGTGIGSQLLLDQAEAYGDLLDAVMRGASQEVCITDLLAPLTRLGVVEVDGEQMGAIVTAWHPLRLAEIAAKARQLAASMARIVTSTGDQRAGVEDFVNDRVATHAGTYYGDVAVLNVPDPTLFAETQSVADYTLLEVTTGIKQHGATDEPTESAVAAFDRVGNEYLKLRPHERANFSVVILNADSENLPLAMANGLARRIEDDPDIRCELVVTDDDPTRLRQVYERQNRRISLEIDSGLASEAARSFLSRLRVGIFSPETLAQQGGQKANDVVLLQDVISRSSSVRWSKGELNPDPEPIETFVPTARSKRRPFRKGNTTSALYLTAPRQPAACRSYVDAVRNVIERDVVLNDEPWLPVQEVAFRTGEVHDILAKAHALGVWVMTFDRVADRRLISSDARRIIRYFSVPGSTHNVIVSTEITVDDLGDCISDGLDVILPGADIDTLATLRRQIFDRAAQLSGDVVMRGAQWSNYARELLGLVLAQREVDRLLRDGRENRTAWFFLDDYYEWLDLSGERADILAIDFSVAAGQPEIRIVVAEAKYVGQEGIGAEEKRSAGQLEKTWLALQQRLLGGDVNLDPTIWRHRLADMILEHMDPFDQVGGIAQDEWLEALRTGTIPLKVDGHSLVFSHDRPAVTEPMPRLPDSAEPIGDRRRLAQWLFSRDETAAMLRALPDDAVPPSIAIPEGWPGSGSDDGTLDAGGDPDGDPDAGPDGDLPTSSNAASDAVEERDQDDQTIVRVSLSHDDMHDEMATVDDQKADPPVPQKTGPWSPEIAAVLRRLSRAESQADGEAWLESQIAELRTALQTENVDAPILGQRLTPNTGLVYVGGRTLTTGWLERKQRDLLTRYGLDIVRISPMPGQIAIGLRRPKRSILHLADAWLRRTSVDGPAQLAAPLLGEREDDGQPCFLPLAAEYSGQERAAPHSLISGTTGSGKGILVTNLMLDLCALNGPGEMDLHLIDPKRGVDYAWARRLPHLRGGIVDSQDDAKALLLRLVADMEARYEEIAAENCRNIDQYNRKVTPQRRMPRVVIFFDEVANWMQDDDFKDVVDGLINKIATKSRAAGFHLFMVYQRADNQVMTMQLRTNLGNKLILRLGDEGSSKIALNEKGAERLLGKGHLIAKLDTDEKIYLQVPYIGDEEVEDLAEAVIDTWTRGRRQEAAE